MLTRNFSRSIPVAKLAKFSTQDGPQRVSREARRARRDTLKQTGQKVPGASASWWVGVVGMTGGIGIFSWAISPMGKETPVGKFIVNSYAYKWVAAQLEEISRPLSEPSAKKLLPDWPYYPNVPPDYPCPPTLVIDVEGTLCTSTWDPKYGWRHAKRPGVDNFLKSVSRYYEVVLFSSNQAAAGEPVVHALDKDQMVFLRLFREATKFHNGAYVKDLSHMNRDMKKIILLDDDPAAFQLQPQNAIQIKPYTDAYDKDDSELEDLIPFLAALVNEGATDFPSVLRSFGTNDAHVIASEYSSKLRSVKHRQEEAQTKGLGLLLRSIPVKQQQQQQDSQFHIDMSKGAAKAAVKKADESYPSQPAPLKLEQKGRLWKRLDAAQQKAEEEKRKKYEEFMKEQEKKQNGGI